MAEPLITPVLSSEDRTACGHGAEMIGQQAYRYASPALYRSKIHPEDAAYLTARLATYRRLCVLAGVEPKPHWVEQIEAAIALPEAKS